MLECIDMAVVLTTNYTQEVLKAHQAAGHAVNEEDFEDLSPAGFAHIKKKSIGSSKLVGYNKGLQLPHTF